MLPQWRRFPAMLALSGSLVVLAGWPIAAGQEKPKEQKAPSLSVRASPRFGFAPLRVTATAELKGGPDDYEEYYCTSVEWDWGDGTISEFSYDCDPYEPGKSEIRRRFVNQHSYRSSGEYRIEITLKRKNKGLVAANTEVEVQSGIRPDNFIP